MIRIPKGPVKLAGGVFATVAGYYGLAVVGTVLTIPPTDFAILWPATAFLMAVLILVPPGLWWLYLLAIVPAHFDMVDRFQKVDVPVVVVLCQLAGNFGLATVAALAVRTTIGTSLRFGEFARTAAFIVLVVGAFALVDALVLCLFLGTGWVADFWLAWQQRLLASLFPLIAIPPVVVLAIAHRRRVFDPAAWRTLAELAAVLAGLVAVGFLVFRWRPPGPAFGPALLLVPLPLLLWAAMRLGVGGVSAALIAFASSILIVAGEDRGPFAAMAPMESVLSIQVFLTTMAIPLILLAALVQERKSTEAQLRLSEARMALAAQAGGVGLWRYDFRTGRLWSTDHCRSMFGIGDDAAPSVQRVLDAIHPDDRAAVMSQAVSAGPEGMASRIEFRVGAGDAACRWFVLTVTAERDDGETLIGLGGTLKDVTRRKAAELETERLAARLEKVREEEWRRIASDLHDSTAQNLVASGLCLANLRQRLGENPDATQLIAEIQELLSEAIEEIRTFTYLLHPPRLAQDGLAATLERYTGGFGRRTGLATRFKVSPGADELPLALQEAVLRMVQEGLNNTYRHAAATQVSVNLRRIGGAWHLLIADDGRSQTDVALRPGEPAHAGVGIVAMTDRLNRFGGRLSIRSSGRGTTVHAAIPSVAARRGGLAGGDARTGQAAAARLARAVQMRASSQ